MEGLPPAFTGRNWAGAAWLAIVGTGLAYSLWFRGIERLPAASVSFLILLSPLVASVLGWVLLDQSLTAGQLAGAALIALAVIPAQFGGSATRSTVPDDPVGLPGPINGREYVHAC